MSTSRKKIAVIGGGMSAMSTIYNITQTKDWRQKYDITVYQMGWRIGGKGASGRNMEEGARIEEHGLHIWFGFYNNAFNLIKNVYEEYAKVGNTSPLQTWSDAFKPQSYIPLFENYDDKWTYWGLDFPTNSEEPGGMSALLPLHEYVDMVLEFLEKHLKETEFPKKEANNVNKGCLTSPMNFFIRKTEEEAVEYLSSHGSDIIGRARAIIAKHEHKVGDSSHAAHAEFKDTIKEFDHWLKNLMGDLLSHNATTRHLFILFDLGITCIKGVLEDQVFEKGFDSINDIEFMDWLRKYGAANVTIESTLITALYDVGFAYIDGNLKERSYEAGSALRIILRLGLTYHGAFMWKMQAGMGDTIFTPIYKVFNSYEPTEDLGGITFKFFHEITNLELAKDKKSIAKIHFNLQAKVKDDKEYNPLVTVNEIPCWPNQPDFSQLVDGDNLKHYNFESFWSPWKGEPMSLEQGKDYDIVLLGTPIATLPYLCSELIDADPKWQTMIDKVKTTQTQAYQLWLKPTLKELGWDDPSPIATSYVEPVDTWADMAQLIDREVWPEGIDVGDIAYFCGVLQDAPDIPPSSDHKFPAKQKARVYSHLLNYTKNDIKNLWPKATDPNNPNGLDYSKLIDTKSGVGEERLKAQFWRANIDPSERYTLTNVDSSKFRLDTDQTETFGNLYVVGDWIQNDFNYGCIECCSMSGILAARAITGAKIPMSAEKGIFPEVDSDKTDPSPQ